VSREYPIVQRGALSSYASKPVRMHDLYVEQVVYSFSFEVLWLSVEIAEQDGVGLDLIDLVWHEGERQVNGVVKTG